MKKTWGLAFSVVEKNPCISADLDRDLLCSGRGHETELIELTQCHSPLHEGGAVEDQPNGSL